MRLNSPKPPNLDVHEIPRKNRPVVVPTPGCHAPEPDDGLIRREITGHTVMVTGAAGSIGSELCRQLGKLSPARLVPEATRYFMLIPEAAGLILQAGAMGEGARSCTRS